MSAVEPPQEPSPFVLSAGEAEDERPTGAIPGMKAFSAAEVVQAAVWPAVPTLPPSPYENALLPGSDPPALQT